jgi:molybdate transport system permease protein
MSQRRVTLSRAAPGERIRAAAPRLLAASGAVVLLALLLVPMFGLLLSASPAELWAGLQHPAVAPALWLSARTSFTALALVTLLGTPLAYWLAKTRSAAAELVSLAIDLPIVVPPAVVGIALLFSFGQRGLLGPALAAIGWRIPFSSSAVVLAQIVVSAPFYLQSAATAFRKVDADAMIVARTLGASAPRAFLRVAVPIALPGLLSGAALSWARSLGEFGATLVFAGSLPGVTQTMPLAIYTTLESDVRAALGLSVLLAAVAIALLLVLRVGPRHFLRRGGQSPRRLLERGRSGAD